MLLGARRAIWVARTLHVIAVVLLAWFVVASPFGMWSGIAVFGAAVFLAWEHRLVQVDDYSKLDAAFFTANGIISSVIMVGALLDVGFAR